MVCGYKNSRLSWLLEYSFNLLDIYRSSCLDVFYKKVALRNFAEFSGKHLCQSLFDSGTGVSLNFAKFPRAPFLTEHL